MFQLAKYTEKYKLIILIFIILSLLGLYLYGSILHLYKVNTDIHSTDQDAYINYAKNLKVSGYKYVGGRNRMPLYPFIQSLFYQKNMSDNDFFIQGKFVNIFLSIILLIIIFLFTRRYLSNFLHIQLFLITAFSIFLFKAAYFQTELLFYTLNFLSFFYLCKLLIYTKKTDAAIAGILLAFAHLSKASVLPGIALFVLMFSFKILAEIIQMVTLQQRLKDIFSRVYHNLFCLIIIGIIFLTILSPYLIKSKTIFGKYFYNVNSTFYFWYDSWEEAKAGTRAHGDRVGWPDMPEDEIPSLQKYLQEHSTKQIAVRLFSGYKNILISAYLSYGYFKYILLFGLLGFFLFIFQFRQTKIFIYRHIYAFLFVIIYFSVYYSLYAWYYYIVSGCRLFLAQLLPFMFVLFKFIDNQKTKVQDIKLNKFSLIRFFEFGLLVFIVLEIFYNVFYRITTIYGGS